VTILNLERAPAATVAPADPGARYRLLSHLAGLWVILVSGDFAVEGRILKVVRPNIFADAPAPLVTIDTGTGLLTGPVLAGDLVSAPLS
jgi:hypothetical protein